MAKLACKICKKLFIGDRCPEHPESKPVENWKGRVIILEFSIPENRFMRRIYLFYFRYLLPQIGSLVSGDGYAYRYLNKTVETFPYGDKFCNLLTLAGFEKVSMYPQTFGIVTIYHGDKPRQT